jgi:predicted metalloendopeptidase
MHPRRPGARTIALTAIALLASCKPADKPSSAFESEIPDLPPLKVVDVAYMDTTVDACVDFYSFANGGWQKRDTIPAAYSSTGVGRDMADRNELVVRAVLEDAASKRASLPDTSTEHKLGTFYASCMDSTAAEQAGLDPIRPTLAAIDSIDSRGAFIPAVAALQTWGVNVLFRYSPSVDIHDTEHYMADVDRGGLGLPDRDYYIDAGASADSTRKAYVAHITRMFVLAGQDSTSATADAARVLSLETALAKAQLPRVARRDPAATDHPMSMVELQRLAPGVEWGPYFRSVGVSTPVARINVGEPAYLKTVSAIVTSRPLEDLRAYLRYHALDAAAPWLDSTIVNEDFAFSSRFTGAKELLPRWKRCLRATDDEMGEALGKAYVARTFPPEAKAKAKEVIDDVRAAFRERLLALDWMSDSTRAQALEKLSRLGEKVGYPDVWRDYTKLRVSDGPFATNIASAERFEWYRTADRPGKEVDRSEWHMTVPTVNAYYDPTVNEMVFPAGALVPQTFDPNADYGANYGSLAGSWAGHELTHGFDDEGRHFDAEGNLRDWWTPADSKRFDTQAALMVKQYDGYIQVDTLHVNGKLTLGENIADYGGALTGYDALERALEKHGRPGPIDGFTPEQRYFIAFAQSFRSHTRDASLRTRVKVDPHSPGKWRVNGPLSDMEAFAKAFSCKTGDPMVRPRAEVAKIW